MENTLHNVLFGKCIAFLDEWLLTKVSVCNPIDAWLVTIDTGVTPGWLAGWIWSAGCLLRRTHVPTCKELPACLHMWGTNSTTGDNSAFSGANLITGATSSATGTPSTTTETVTLANSNTVSLTTGYANPELQPDSGQIVYLENRKPIARASDQTEDIKLIIEF